MTALHTCRIVVLLHSLLLRASVDMSWLATAHVTFSATIACKVKFSIK